VRSGVRCLLARQRQPHPPQQKGALQLARRDPLAHSNEARRPTRTRAGCSWRRPRGDSCRMRRGRPARFQRAPRRRRQRLSKSQLKKCRSPRCNRSISTAPPSLPPCACCCSPLAQWHPLLMRTLTLSPFAYFFHPHGFKYCRIIPFLVVFATEASARQLVLQTWLVSIFSRRTPSADILSWRPVWCSVAL
jgi:hypothetical protein